MPNYAVFGFSQKLLGNIKILDSLTISKMLFCPLPKPLAKYYSSLKSVFKQSDII